MPDGVQSIKGEKVHYQKSHIEKNKTRIYAPGTYPEKISEIPVGHTHSNYVVAHAQRKQRS
ncbi:MAG: hypothetical protein ACPL3Q_09420 [Candidatus Ratteibacteria bacterium]